jgi:hypothetical protein
MNPELNDYGARSADGEGPSISLQQRAFAVVAEHPHYLEAAAHEYCCPTVMLEPKSVVDRCKWDGAIKRHIAAKLVSSDMVLLLSCFTANKQPEPLAGHGKTYHFVMHPDTLEIIHTSTGQWRS